MMANATDPAQARREVEPTLLSLLSGFPPLTSSEDTPNDVDSD
jgi:hypothetical protein